MLYDLLGEYRNYLETFLQKETAKTYANRLEFLFERQNRINTLQNLDIQKILENLSKVKYKNQFSQCKNAFFYFVKYYNLQLDTKYQNQIKKLEEQTHRKYRKSRVIDYTQISKKIKYLRNKKLKLCYMTLIESGLRVSELSQITSDNCVIESEFIKMNFIGKGGNLEEITISKKDNLILYKELKEMIEQRNPTRKIFYSANYLQTNAEKLGFCCHDLRRICAKLEYKKTKSKKAVMEKLRHSNIKTTEIYLKSNVKF